MTDAIAEQVELGKRVSPDNSFPLPVVDSKLDTIGTADLQNLINVLLPEDRNASRENAVEPIGRQLEKLLERWFEREITPQKLRDWGQPVIYIGDPGVGKTDIASRSSPKRYNYLINPLIVGYIQRSCFLLSN
ncbi:hypothetical protein MEO94_29135 [Dolichospermum sp. ST_sed9]|nr:hypothetical protein [Dolichospermum sp. ST_sed9]